MSARAYYAQLDSSLRAEPLRLKRIRAKLGTESWARYEAIGSATSDEDFYSCVLEFVVGLEDRDLFRSELTSEQKATVDALQDAMKQALGLHW